MLRFIKIIFLSLFILNLVSHALADDCAELIQAAKHGDIEEIQELLDEGCDADTKDNNDWTPLLFAAQKDHTDIVKLLIEKGANPDHLPVKDGKTALMWAVGEANIDTVKLLIEKGADVNLKNSVDLTALRIAKRRKFDDIIKLLIESGAKE